MHAPNPSPFVGRRLSYKAQHPSTGIVIDEVDCLAEHAGFLRFRDARGVNYWVALSSIAAIEDRGPIADSPATDPDALAPASSPYGPVTVKVAPREG
jgi:hypothetical protein